ncbi:hypothetical protein ACJX0J_013359, partial [Zea mays]
MESAIRDHPLWANATDQEIDHALEVKRVFRLRLKNANFVHIKALYTLMESISLHITLIVSSHSWQ